MKMAKGLIFNSKILLFGEYSLMKGSMALGIPFEKYNGQLLFDADAAYSLSKHYSVAYLLDYLEFLIMSGNEKHLNLYEFKHDIEHGLIFITNIPISYGLGSSGAIVASIYNAYAKAPADSLDELKNIFSKMESYYHGKSSGFDPLISYLNKAILVNENHENKPITLPKLKLMGNGGVFLVDTKTIGKTQPLVNWFIQEYENQEFADKILNQMNPLNNRCISSLLSGNFSALISDVKLLSQFTFNNFKPMIPNSIEEIWKIGLKTNNYYLKLCGSGGGGMMLGFTDNLEKAFNELAGFDTHILMSSNK